MRPHRTSKWIVAAFVVCCMPAFALEADEIGLLVRRSVDDSTIMDVVRTRPLTRPLTAQDVVMLHKAGASSQLLSFLTGPEAVAVQYESVTTPATETVVVVSPPPVTYYQQPCVTPQYITPAPVVVVPPVVYRNYYPDYYPGYYPQSTWSFSFGSGGRDRYWRGDRYRDGFGGPRYDHRSYRGRRR